MDPGQTAPVGPGFFISQSGHFAAGPRSGQGTGESGADAQLIGRRVCSESEYPRYQHMPPRRQLQFNFAFVPPFRCTEFRTGGDQFPVGKPLAFFISGIFELETAGTVQFGFGAEQRDPRSRAGSRQTHPLQFHDSVFSGFWVSFSRRLRRTARSLQLPEVCRLRDPPAATVRRKRKFPACRPDKRP